MLSLTLFIFLIDNLDAMSHYGVARDLMVGLKFKKLISSNTNLKDLPTKSELTFNKKDNIQINIENPKLQKSFLYSWQGFH